jgi:hypothetical protein
MRTPVFPRSSLALACWSSFLDWLGSEVAGWLPYWHGQPSGLLPVARQMSGWLGPWIQRQMQARAAQPPLSKEAARQQRWQVVADLQFSVLRSSEVRLERGWVETMWRAEQARLLRLLEASTWDISRTGWLPYEARYWALVVCLTRLSQLAAAWERCPEREALAV